MAEDQQAQQGNQDSGAPEIGGGTYEVIRKRLGEQATQLRERVDRVNQRRLEIFGGVSTELLATVRVRTEHNCVPRDLVRTHGDTLLLGYQVHLGLKSETRISDVFAKFSLEEEGIVPADFAALRDERFQKDFQELMRYYKDARLLQLRRTETQLLMVFQTGQRLSDIRVLRWAVQPDGISYIDNRGERDHTFPPAHDFAWTRATREMQVLGVHPHININDTIFVEAIEGDLTIKVEDNTDSGAGIYAEAVDDPNQSLDDADISFADLENAILLRIRPYREDDYRYIVYNKQTQTAIRLDDIGCSCQQLPEGHGLIFPNGYYLQDGSHKVFPYAIDDMEFITRVRSPNGVDVAYVFHHRDAGSYAILQYNLINRSVTNPLICNGYSLAEDGRLVLFRAEREPQRVHAMQIWSTPFCTEEHAASQPARDDSHLATIGNRSLVRGISDIYQILRLIAEQRPNRAVYEELLRSIATALDAHYWLGHEEAAGLREQLLALQQTANTVIDEFEKVLQLREQAAQQVQNLQAERNILVRSIELDDLRSVDDHVTRLDALRDLRGRVSAAQDIRYVDVATLEQLDADLGEQTAGLSQRTVDLLMDSAALDPYRQEIADIESAGAQVATVSEAAPLQERLQELSTALDLLMEIVGSLDIADSTQRTGILEGISAVFGLLNRATAVVDKRRRACAQTEGRSEFGAQFTLLGQSVANYLGMCDTPERCDELLARAMLQLEELEGRFVDFDEFAADLASKREEIYDSFNARKQQLLDERQRRADGITRAAERIVAAITKRARTLPDEAALGSYFASDPMVQKARALIRQLEELDVSVQADDLLSRLKSAREDAVRLLRDQSELFDEAGTVQLGRHRFTVNTQSLELTMLPRDDVMYLHLSGTDFFEPVTDEDFLATRPYWGQTLVSENQDVYRSEYLAWQILSTAERAEGDLDLDRLRAAAREDQGLQELVRSIAGQRYDEGYERGIHDHDAALLLDRLLHMHDTAGLLRFPRVTRCTAVVSWHRCMPVERRRHLATRARSLGRLRSRFAAEAPVRALAASVQDEMAAAAPLLGVDLQPSQLQEAARYLIEELILSEEPHFVLDGRAARLVERFAEQSSIVGSGNELEQDLTALGDDLTARIALVQDWLEAFAHSGDDAGPVPVLEAALHRCLPDLPRETIHARITMTVEDLLGQHPRIDDGVLRLDLDEYSQRLERFCSETVPAWRAYQRLRHAMLERERERLRLEEFAPRVLTSFVRNRLINEVYLPMIGANFAKQIGTAGDSKRTDLMGMLLLISPPGYGKTTLMEYIASVLGLIFMKINGPALGHDVTALDPAQAPNATAAQELRKLNLAFEMGNNVLIYVDDIQHCHPEFLQKFISLCDGQRRIEGVWNGRSRTYDLRGKKVAVVMAGNPYTESGERFRIPDMLANRADTYNLGDIIGGAQEAFELSYLENCLSVNGVLAPLATRPREDFVHLLRMSQGDEEAQRQLNHPYSALELEEITSVLRHLKAIQEIILRVNQTYIASAATAETDRTEPPFKLQGSYRNMAKLAEHVVSVMSPQERTELLRDHYRGESQTLTNGAESNFLKFAVMCDCATPEEATRWEAIRRGFHRRQELGDEDDPMRGALMQLVRLNEGLGTIGAALQRDGNADPTEVLRPLAAELVDRLAQVQERPIEIINTFPRYYGQLYEHHIAVLERTLAPAMQAIGMYLDRDLKEPLQDLVQHLRSLIQRSRSAERYHGEDDQIDELD
ncbi:MAG: DNA repair ATPase [Planctomycetota bacterium]